jgi:hypothetical protein
VHDARELTMKIFPRLALIITIACLALILVPVSTIRARADDDPSLLQADRSLIQALATSDKPALDQLLDHDFTRIDSNGKSQTRAQFLENLPAISNPDVEAQVRNYGNSTIVRADRERMNVMRVWVRRGSAWRLILYQEVLQVPKSEPPPAAEAGSNECENPCKTVPFHPDTESEREAIISWQGVMRAMANNDAGAYAPLIADEFTATDTHHDRPYNKADRLAQINKQQLSGARSFPPALVSARMFDFGDIVMMIAREQRANAKAYFNTRMWVKRDGRWQMLFSFNTRIE